jgi:predicted dehydrogenase
MATIRTAILGYGRNGSTMHAGGIEAMPEMEMIAACDIDPERRKQAEERFDCTTYEDYKQMLEKEQLDLVVIVTRSDQHCDMTCDCLEAGVNVLVTKPWAVNEAEAKRMVETAERTGNKLLPWLPSRWSIDLRELRDIVEAGTIGNVFWVRRLINCYATRSDWQTQRKHGGGYLLNWGPHIVDTAISLIDSPVASVYGRMKQIVNPNDGEDVFAAYMTLKNGTVVTAEHAIAATPLPNWYIQGDAGTIVVHGHDVAMHKGAPPRPDDPTAYGTMKGKEIEVEERKLEGALFGDTNEVYKEIVSELLGKAPYPVTTADAYRLTQVLDAIRASDAENRVVSLI